MFKIAADDQAKKEAKELVAWRREIYLNRIPLSGI
jgi:hypothetical protein